jgi:hypothetical protein
MLKLYGCVFVVCTAFAVLAAGFEGHAEPGVAVVTDDVPIDSYLDGPTKSYVIEVNGELIWVENVPDEINEDPPDKPLDDTAASPRPDAAAIAPQPQRDDRARPHQFRPRPRPDLVRP